MLKAIKSIQSIEGNHLSEDDLNDLLHYTRTYDVRLKTYQLVAQMADSLIAKTLVNLEKTDRETVQKHRDICQRDMRELLILSARSILIEDPDGFNEFLLWMQNMMRSLKKEAQAARAYLLLQQAVTAEMPPDCAKLVNTCLQQVIDILQVGV